MNDRTAARLSEHVVLSKFDGDALPENEFERVTIDNGVVTEHVNIVAGNKSGSVLDSNLIGKDVGTIMVGEEVN